VSEPQRQSALHDRHLEAGAHLQAVSGWQMPAWYDHAPPRELEAVRQGVGISDASYLTKLDLRGHANELPAVPPARVWVLTPNHALMTSPETIAFIPSTSVTDVTSVYGGILLAGPKSRDVLHKLTTLNLREQAFKNGAARQARLAHVNATILRVDHEDIPGFLLLHTRDVLEHVWQSLLHAGNAFGARPFGVVAQQTWLGTA
jgi:sarcosine oxidase, subunit alpha